MNRRELMLGVGVVTVQRVAFAAKRFTSQVPAQSALQGSGVASLPQVVAGIRLVDSKIARNATALGQSVYPPYLFNHAVRTYLLGALTGRARGQHFDEELLFLACILHDLGLTERFEGDMPFEILGAESAKHFLEENAYAAEGIQIVWDGIAMHASAIGQFKRPEIALVGEGAGADVLGPDPAQITKSDIEEILKAFPRLGFKNAFIQTCAEVLRKHPRSASRGFMRDIGERYVRDFHPHNFCDLVAQAPFPD
jgi:hypothetical protein